MSPVRLTAGGRAPQLLLTCLVLVAFLTGMSSGMVRATQLPEYEFNIPAQAVETALDGLAKQAKVLLLFPYDPVIAVDANPVVGVYSVEQALIILLKGTGLKGDLTEGGVITITRKPSSNNEGDHLMINKQTRKTLLAGIAAFFSAAVTASNVTAQEPDTGAASGGVLEEIVVTAQKRAQKLSDVPMSVAVLNDEVLDKKGINKLVDLALSVPGLAILDSGPATRRITMRGVGNSSGFSSLIGVYVDEIPATAAPLTQLDLRLYDLERVEVLRGPQGTLYGQGSTGGTLRFITKRPDLDEYSGSMDMSASDTQAGEGSYEFKGVVNLPLIEDTLAVRLAGMYAREGGWIDQPQRSLEDINDQEVKNLNLKAFWQATNALDVAATVIIHRNDTGAASMGEDEGGNYEQPFFLTTPSVTTPSFEDDYELYNLTATYDLGAIKLLSTSSYAHTKKAATNQAAVLQIAPPPGVRTGLVFTSLNTSETFTQEVRVSSNDEGPLNWIVGGFYRNLEQETDSEDRTFFGAVDQTPFGPLTGFDIFETSESWAVFGQVSYLFAQRLEVGGGLRYFEDDRAKPRDPQDASFDSLTPRVFARYDLTEDISLYANVAKGFRSGGFNSSPQNPAYDPETLWSYEGGVKASLLENRVNMELTVFYSDYTDIQITGLVPVVVDGVTIQRNILSNVGEAEIRGIEALVDWRLTDRWSVGFTGAITDTEVTEVNAGNPSKNMGDELDLVPRYSYGLWTELDIDWTADISGFVRLDYNQQGKSTTKIRNIGPHYFSESDVLNILDAKIAAIKGNWRVELFARNLFNERGFIDSSEIEAAASRVRPRTLGVEIGLDF